MIAYRLRCAVTRLLLKLAKRWHTDSLIAYRNHMLKDAFNKEEFASEYVRLREALEKIANDDPMNPWDLAQKALDACGENHIDELRDAREELFHV
ncbi:MAG: hypothetical protein HRU18_18315 [Pseudoalteromonas sp.]|uniref:hypothetical protein n=1 Tax=Pseudoalteromonas sp. TaxID=53249 RepID=UPI001DC64942|nr:hypothetical protein [Pseudoalteromonas sp.]NRA80159.1 hypothetical protein [Pseudoalteromonas sp.]